MLAAQLLVAFSSPNLLVPDACLATGTAGPGASRDTGSVSPHPGHLLSLLGCCSPTGL